jgi:hypothetical protein
MRVPGRALRRAACSEASSVTWTIRSAPTAEDAKNASATVTESQCARMGDLLLVQIGPLF